MLSKNLFIGVPIGAVVCYLFMLFSFLNVPSTKAVRRFRFILFCCLAWAGGAVLMRLQIPPGIGFWYNISLTGIFMVVIGIYAFLFCILEVGYEGLLMAGGLFTFVAMLLNSVFGVMLPPPEVIEREDGTLVYTYTSTGGVYLLVVPELILLLVVIWITLRKVRGNVAMLKRLFPVFLGIFFLAFGSLIEIIPGNVFPYDTLFAVFMAMCFGYIMLRYYLFDISYRATIGVIYSVACSLILIVVWVLSFWYVRSISATESLELADVISCMLLVSVIAVFISFTAHSMSERVLERYNFHTRDSVNKYISETASLFSEEELFLKLDSLLDNIFHNMQPCLYLRNAENGEYIPFRNKTSGITQQKMQEYMEIVESGESSATGQVSLLRYDGQIRGFVGMDVDMRKYLNYMELECLHSIVAQTNVCLKNINIYEQVHQVTIHDEITGQYNRYYWNEYQQKMAVGVPHGLISLDIDDFKLVNEIYGEKTGDGILNSCGKMMEQVVGDRGCVFRIGGNEFLIEVATKDMELLLGIAKEIQKKAIEEKKYHPHILQPVTFSIGIAMDEGELSDFAELQRRADKATFYAKQNGKNRIEIYESAIEEKGENQSVHYEQIAPIIYSLMAAIDAKDSITFEHSNHVSEYAVLLGQKLGIFGEELQVLKEAGLLHDVGKIGIPESILTKKGRLTDEEYQVMKGHVQNSVEMIHFLPNMNYVIPAVLSHHERYDGKGYPRGTKGEDIPYLGRILAVCDSFDAMVSKRSYKDEMSVDYAVDELRKNSGTQFDPVVAAAFIQLIEEHRIVV